MISKSSRIWALASLTLFSPVLCVRSLATDPDAKLAQARELFLSGLYDEALETYSAFITSDAIEKSAQDAIAAACGAAEVDIQKGRYELAISRLMSVKEVSQKSPFWHASMAALLAIRGDYASATQHNNQALELDKKCYRARWQLGQLQEMLGEFKAAEETYRYFNDVMTGSRLPESAEDLTYLGQGFIRYSTLVRHADQVRRTRHVLTEVFQEAFEFVDSLYWPARLAGAELLLDKHNLKEAGEDFEAILAQNENVPAAHVGLARIALEAWDFEDTEKHVKAALDICPGNEDALTVLAAARMLERKYGEAADTVQLALKTNPNSIPALSILAAARLRQGDNRGSELTQENIKKLNPRPAVLYYELGRWLAAGRQYAPAEAMLKKAVEYAPAWAEPATELGQLYMEMGEEVRARKTLEAAFTLDSFNQHSHNVLLLLNTIDGFARHETAHFVIKYDEKLDGVLIPYLAEALEKFYEEVCMNFSVKPEKKTTIEIFPDHMNFSVRVTGRPFIATVGACTGPVIAMQAPRGAAPFGQFNWASTLRHEFTHTVTLAATENRIPHWMTEGMAVHEEPCPRTWRTKQLLSEAVRQSRLFTLESIDWGFMRPKRRDDRELAYAQSEWMIDYIISKYGKEAAGDLLKSFNEGLTQAQAFDRVLKKSPEDFSNEFAVFAKKEVDAWGLPEYKLEDPRDLEKQLETDSENGELWARLARAQAAEGKTDEAEKAARKAIQLCPHNPFCMEAFAAIMVGKMVRETDEDRRGEYLERAEPILRKLLAIQPENMRGVLYMGYAQQGLKNWDEAIELYKKYRRRYPDDPDTYRRMAGIYLVTGKEQEALAMLEKVFSLVDDEARVARQIGEIYAGRGDWAKASNWYNQAVQIDAYDYETHAMWGRALVQLKDWNRAKREFDAAAKLRPGEPEGWLGMAEVAAAEGDAAKAAQYKKKVYNAPLLLRNCGSCFLAAPANHLAATGAAVRVFRHGFGQIHAFDICQRSQPCEHVCILPFLFSHRGFFADR